MKKTVLILIIAAMLGWAIYDFVLSKENGLGSGEVGNTEGDIAPDFELTTLDGENVRLSDYRGKRVMINFWATWCPPCRAEMPDMQKLYEKEDVVILAVNLRSTEKNDEVVIDFVKEYGLSFPIPMDVENEVASMFEVNAYPTSYLIDSEGRIQHKAIGAMNYDKMVQEFENMN
ncbi:peroxiredoxin family protein [Oceanobacillus senegalensis]|uniref:peroxiredoxin family protein n=1 Tax=Oceanobacillus senegalensis TaxID=1936063 RepID=UPI000A3076C0|nr:redoxin domain-containing protein [Oceanobacillus senegalensis]